MLVGQPEAWGSVATSVESVPSIPANRRLLAKTQGLGVEGVHPTNFKRIGARSTPPIHTPVPPMYMLID